MKEYPDVGNLVLGDIILRCWNSGYRSMQEVLDDINYCCEGIVLLASHTTVVDC